MAATKEDELPASSGRLTTRDINIRTKFRSIGNPKLPSDRPQNCSHLLQNAVKIGLFGSRKMFWRGIQVSGIGRIVLVGALLASGLGIAGLRAQTVLGDPRDAARTFASNCSACHKSPRGLAKSGQVAGFLRQHYTTGSEMSAAMAAYLVAAGSAPAEKKTAAGADGTAAKTKGKKQDQVAAQSPADAAEAMQQRTLRGKQRAAKSQDEAAAPAHVPPPAAPAAEETKQAAAAAAVTPSMEPAAAPAQPAPMVLDIPLPPMPDAPPPDLVQSVFASSPLP